MPKLKRGIALTKLIRIFPKINMVISSSVLICLPCFKALAEIVIEISSWQEKHDQQMDEGSEVGGKRPNKKKYVCLG